MEIFTKDIGQRIKKRRKELNLTQNQVRVACGISSGALSEIENGNRAPSIIIFHALAEVLDCSMDWLATGFQDTKHQNHDISSSENSLLDRLVSGFQSIPEESKEEILELIELKLQKNRKETLKFLSGFHSLSEDDREEFMVLLDTKLRKKQISTNHPSTSFHSSNPKDTDMVG